MLEKWKKAVVHLECATDSEHYIDRFKKWDELRNKLEKGEITEEDYHKGITGGTRDQRYHGTALFIQHNNRNYLLTARHVVFDEFSAKREFEEEIKRASTWPEHMQQSMLKSSYEQTQNRIFSIIFRVPSLNEVVSRKNENPPMFLMNLGAGTSYTVPYTFSSPELDLAIISLDQRNTTFSEDLLNNGYIPITSEEISDEPTKEGSEVFTVGYPSATALIGQMNQYPASEQWSSCYFSLPVFTFGRVSMLHEKLNFYWTDMSIYPGNSGGPVIENGKLVGIVSAQATLPIDDVPNISTRIPFGKIMKTKYVWDLIRVQEEKDKYILNPGN